eukprot:783034-Rhodomonas_salina.3
MNGTGIAYGATRHPMRCPVLSYSMVLRVVLGDVRLAEEVERGEREEGELRREVASPLSPYARAMLSSYARAMRFPVLAKSSHCYIPTLCMVLRKRYPASDAENVYA